MVTAIRDCDTKPGSLHLDHLWVTWAGPMAGAGLAALMQKAFVRTDDLPEDLPAPWDAATGAPTKNVATPAPHLDTGDEMGGKRNGERPAPVGVYMMDVDQDPPITIGNA